MSDKVKDIADLLPEGMSEELISEIAKVMQDIISERLDEEMDMLTNKVHAFLRHQMDTVQEAALEELSESHEIYRDAQALKDIKTVLAFEIDRDDLNPVVSQVSEDIQKVEKDNEVLAYELSEAIKENNRLDRVLTNYEDKMEVLTEQNNTLQDSVVNLEEEVNSDFESTEKAIIITENVDNPITDKRPVNTLGNPFLTEEVMAFMPDSKN
jgi:predicted  nucleic acid-binding Zn-ribbon protein